MTLTQFVNALGKKGKGKFLLVKSGDTPPLNRHILLRTKADQRCPLEFLVGRPHRWSRAGEVLGLKSDEVSRIVDASDWTGGRLRRRLLLAVGLVERTMS